MDRELVRQTASDHGEATNGTSPQPDSSIPTTPTPPRLTPNPMLLDSPAPTLTPTTSSPPPPLTPAPSVSVSHSPKAAVTAASPHILVPAPPKLTSTATPTLRTYSRPILPSPGGASKSSPASQTSASSSLSSSSSSLAVATASPLISSSSATHVSTTMSTKTSTTLTNGNTRPVSTPTSTPITPFHTPASPPGRQVSQTLPGGTPGLVRANQSPSPVRQRVSQQTLLLGKGLKGSGQDQVLLRAQMLQSLTLRPPPPGALTIPPSLRLKPPSSAPPPLSRPHAPLFPPLRPRPQPSTTATESPTTPSRHLSVPPPTLYSPVRAVPLRPRLYSPNGHRVASPRQTSTLQPIAAAPSGQAPPIGGPLAGLKSCALSQTMLGSGQSQHSSLSVTNPMSASSQFERSPSAARQLQIIALSSGRQPQPGTYAHTAVQSPPSPPPVSEPPEVSSQSKRTLSSEDVLPVPLNPSVPKTSSPLPSPPSLLSPASPPGQAGPQTQTLVQKGEAKDGEEQRERGRGVRQGVRDEGGKDLRTDRDDQRETAKEEKQRLTTEKKISPKEQEQEVEVTREEEQMDVTEEGQSDGDRRDEERKMEEEEEEEEEAAMDQTEKFPSRQPQNTDPVPDQDSVKDSSLESKPILDLTSVQSSAQSSAPAPAPVPVPAPVSEVPVQNQRVQEPQRDLQPVSQEDFCENMSTQSDNQSALSSLSSQSPPSSPFITPLAENPPPLLPAQPVHPTELGLSRHEPEKVDKVVEEPRHPAEAEAETAGQSEDESESFGQSLSSPWEPKEWPEGRQVLTHLVEGFVIQEGLQPFPVNRSSLLVPEQVAKPQEVNGTNGRAALPVTDVMKPSEHSTDSDEEGGDTDDPGTRSGHRDRTVLHCQFCGKRGHAHNFMRSKRFCSTSCARGFNVRLTKRLRALSAGGRSERPRPALNRAESVPGKPLLLRLPRDLWSAGRREKEGKETVAAAEEDEEDEDEDEDMVGGGEEEDDDDGGEEDPAVAMTTRMGHRAARRARRASAPAMTTSTPTTTFKPAPSQWSVEEVTAFIHTLPGCSDVAEAFRLQEIDGQALLLLTEDHLMTSMNIKLGPALKICAHINSLKNQ
ncbi:polyhomeotic-like protein 3 isoform X1 [Echeneis naucrates]|uniref:polyhomeotic-like protein 3 isoform X1 n=1 Tax=Echeneis naucrates TaxID=173247 RepID=UPI0011135F27|nr:polyhomeotic-like protein 3 isoform X1 [Echeneis naucrates]